MKLKNILILTVVMMDFIDYPMMTYQDVMLQPLMSTGSLQWLSKSTFTVQFLTFTQPCLGLPRGKLTAKKLSG